MTDSIHDEISASKIIKASSIFEKFKALFQPLLNKAESNCNALRARIAAINNQDSIVSDYYTFEKTNLENVFNELKCLEENWKDVDSTWEGEGNCPLSKTRPLHLEKRNVIPASGKVRKFDYIAAYNFKGFLQALYGIASELRNIAFRVYEDGEFKPGYSFGNNDRFESYTDLSLLGAVTDSYIPLIEENSKIFSFQDYIINNNTNGDKISVQNDLPGRKTPHGFSDDENNLIPDGIIANASRKEYINSNIKEVSNTIYEFGRQTTNHLQKDGIPTSTPSSLLDNYYNVPSRTDSYNKAVYQSNPTTGVAFEYLTLKPAGAYNTTTNDLISSSFSEVSTDISDCLYIQDPSNNDKILSTPQKYMGTEPEKRQIIRAQTVNNLYREMNTLFVKISASLCGEYKLDFSRSQIPIYNSPKGGLGYPEVFSWYLSHWTKVPGAERYYYLCNTVPSGSDPVYTAVTADPKVEGNSVDQPTAITSKGSDSSMRMVEGILNNGKIIARETISDEKPSIRCGLFWFDYDNINYNTTSYNKNLSFDDFKSTIVSNAYTSFVPMAYNNRKIQEASSHEASTPITSTDYWRSVKLSAGDSTSDNPLTKTSAEYKEWTFTKKKGFLPFNKNTVELSCFAYKDPNKQLFNRNCISNPLEISAYLHDTSNSQMSSLNVNNKYIYTPSINWLNYLACSGNSYRIYNGYIPVYGSQTLERTSIGTGNQYLNPAAGIPVIYDTRENVWNPNAVIKSPTDFEHIGKNDSDISSLYYGTVQLLLNKNRSNERDYLPIDTNYKINWFEYALKCGISINEVNDTHNSKAWTSFKLFNSDATAQSVATRISTSYYLHNEGNGFPPSPASAGADDKQQTLITATSTDGNISSYVYHGYNNYNVKDYTGSAREISNYLRSGLMDMMEILYGSRFKFNDFYNTGSPLSTTGIKVSDIETYFSAGGSNKYAEGLATKCISWVTRISTNVLKSQFNVLHYLYQHHDGDDPDPEHKPALTAGNFFFSGNLSNAINCQIDNDTNKTYFYYIAPQPDPISATRISIDAEHQMFKFTGKCNCFWNDISCIRVNLKPSVGEITSFGLFNPISFGYLDGRRPYKPNPPPTNSIVQYAEENVGEINYDTNYYNIQINLPIPEEYVKTELSCTMRFYNENHGFRDVCKSKDSSNINDGAFKIYEPDYWYVSFDSNGATSGSMGPDPVVKGLSYTLPSCSFTKQDYEFSKWKVGSSSYKDPDETIEISADTIITAIWVETPQPEP